MSEFDRPFIHLVCGSAHSPESWDLLQAELTKLGYQSGSAPHPTVGPEHPEEVTLFDDAKSDREAILKVLDGENKNVLVVAHSYGGCVASELVEGLSIEDRGGRAGVIGIVFLSAWIVAAGQNLFSVVNQTPEEQEQHSKYLTVDGAKLQFFDTRWAFYNDYTDENYEKYSSMLKFSSLGQVVPELKYAAWSRPEWADKCRYVKCSEDMALLPWKQDQMIKRANMKVSATLPSGHIPQGSIPDQLAKVLADIAIEMTPLRN